ncbi:MAG: hypothetical protein H7062_18450 [Candidatus Saccharimonas sp.]|nr:hypothetical protein [Planctomycetaceae bacterium]
MSKPKIEERVAALEAQMQRVLAQFPQPGPDDWEKAVGMFTGDSEMKKIDALGQAWREADRRRAKRPRKRVAKAKS